MKGPRSKLKAIPTVLEVVAKCFLHGRNETDRLHLREGSFNAAGLSKIGKHSYSPHHMLAPALAAPLNLPIRPRNQPTCFSAKKSSRSPCGGTLTQRSDTFQRKNWLRFWRSQTYGPQTVVE